jgi:DNA-binding transcriptional LysR family regulator
MDSLARRLPPLNALVAFEAVVRLGTITAAAAELGTTQPAVSQRIRTLEEALGTTLFRRRGRNLKPSGGAVRYYEEVAAALAAIAAASDTLKPDRKAAQPLVISAPFGFAHLWLAPLLPALEQAFPTLEVVVRAEDDPKFAPARRPDLEIRFGPSAGFADGVRFLMHEIVQPVCSPAFAERHALTPAGATAEVLRTLPLLHLDEEDPRWCNWPRWFAANGIANFRPTPRLYYNNYPLLEQAAIDGKGVALGWHGLVDPQLASGRLVAMGNVFFRREWGYLLHIGNTSSPAARAVADWISAEARPVSQCLLKKFGLSADSETR